MDYAQYYLIKYNLERLNFLRNNTFLGPKATLIVLKKRLEAKKENDYSKANLTEFLLRMKIWERKWKSDYQKYGNHISLGKFVVKILDEMIYLDELKR